MSSNLVSELIPNDRLNAPSSQIAQFCGSCGVALRAKRCNVTEFAVFGSVLRSDFKPDVSDIDVLVAFNSDYSWTFDAAFQMREELMGLFQRKLDLIIRKSLEQSSNWV
ncbi:nucleotidyltransferase domain-containing protein [Cyanobacteria bacterium FACHB-63]|nr:nucleotidyltransferase domain-containing protein [Cyanobacteria bacterium FACHB-63]